MISKSNQRPLVIKASRFIKEIIFLRSKRPSLMYFVFILVSPERAVTILRAKRDQLNFNNKIVRSNN